jgi:hypothetical protein
VLGCFSEEVSIAGLPECGLHECTDPPVGIGIIVITTSGPHQLEVVMASEGPDRITGTIRVVVLGLDVCRTGRCGALVITRVGDCYAVVGEEVLGGLEAADSPSPRLGELRGGRLGVAIVRSEDVRAVHDEVIGETRTQLIPLEKIDVLGHSKCEIDDRNTIA